MIRTSVAIGLLICSMSLAAWAADPTPPAAPVAPVATAGQTPTEKSKESIEDTMKIKREIYVYKSSKNRDPFLSLIRKIKQTAIDTNKLPVERYDVTQMKLIAVAVDAKGKKYALIGLPDGKYYSVYVGNKVGIRDGVVTDIAFGTRKVTQDSFETTPSYVTVREFIENYKHEIVAQDRVIKLQEQGGKK